MSNKQSRFENRDKRRKANLVLNILIAIVSILIVVVAVSLFINSPSSDVSEKADTSQKQDSPASGKTQQKSDEDIKDSKKDTSSDDDKKDKEDKSDSDSDSDSKKDDSSKSDADKSKKDSESSDPFKGATVTEGGSSSSVEKTIVNSKWKAVGTKQTGEHTATYDSSSEDWSEMLDAMAYATGVSKGNMTVLWLGNNGSPQDAKGKILDKTNGKKYQVTITWEDKKGWKPTKVETLK